MEQKKEFSYEIGGRTFFQRPLVLGQIKQISLLLDGMSFPEQINAKTILAVVGPNITEAIAIVLTEEGKPLKDKDISVLAGDLEFSIGADTTLQVVEDFFDCNPLESVFERLAGMAGKIITKLKETRKTITGSTALSQPSAEETSPKETVSSGDTP